MIKKALFIGDIYRPGQEENVFNLCKIFSPTLKEIGVEYEVHISAHNTGETNPESFSYWEKSLVRDNFNSELSSLDLKNFIVIGFEASEVDLAYLDKIGVEWLDFSIHPLRFLDDLYLSVKTSMNLDLSKHFAGKGFIDMCVNVLLQRYPKPIDGIESDALCIFGQRQDDKSVFIDNKFKKLEDYLQKIDKISKNFDNIFYKPHPYNDDKNADLIIKQRYKAEIIDDQDIYRLFMSKRIKAACAISSSVLHEATYFGVESICLDSNNIEFSAPVRYNTLIEDSKLWSEIFNIKQYPKVDILSTVQPPNYLRKVFTSWSFKSDEDFLVERINKAEEKRIVGELESFSNAHKEIYSKLECKLQKSDSAALEAKKASEEAKFVSAAANQTSEEAKFLSAAANQTSEEAKVLSGAANQTSEEAKLLSGATNKISKEAKFVSAAANKSSEEAKLKSEKAYQNSEEAKSKAEQALAESIQVHELVKESKKALNRSLEKVEELSSEVLDIKSSFSWRLIRPVYKLDKFLSLLNKSRKTIKSHKNLRVPWHTHLYRFFVSLWQRTDKPWHTHLYRTLHSLFGHERYSPLRNLSNLPNKPKVDKFDVSERDANGLKIIQLANYIVEEYNQGGKIRSFEIRKALRCAGYFVETISFVLGKESRLKNNIIEVRENDFFKKINDGTISDWAISDFVMECDVLWDSLRKYVKRFNPDVLLVEQPFLWPIAQSLISNNVVSHYCLIVNSTQNIEYNLKNSIYSEVFSNHLRKKYLTHVKFIENEICEKADFTLCVSANDRNYFKQLNTKNSVHVFSNGCRFDSNTIDKNWVKAFKNTQNNWIFVGSWHQPNIDGIRRLVDSGLCNLDSRKVKLWILGSVGEPIKNFIQHFNNNDSVVQIMGESSDADISNSISASTGIIIPIWSGGGSNLKTAQALLSEKQIIATTFAFRGFENYVSESGVKIFDDSSHFVEELANQSFSNHQCIRKGVEKLKWENILKSLPSIVRSEYALKHSFSSDNVFYFDVTSLHYGNGQFTGITRVVSCLNKSLRYLVDNFIPIVYENSERIFCKYDWETQRITKSKIDLSKNDFLISCCDSWNVEGYIEAIEEIASSNSNVYLMIYDCIPYFLPHSFGPGFSKIYKTWLTQILSTDINILTISNHTKSDILSYIKAEKIDNKSVPGVVRLGDSLDRKLKEIAPNLKIKNSFILTVGTIEFRKNHQVLLDAYRILVEKGFIDLPQLIIVGKQGWMDNGINQQTNFDPKISDKILVFNDLNDDYLDYLYENCLFTVYPSFYEGWGLPVAESFSYGKACITSNLSSIPEICSEVSIFADPHDPYDWAEKFEELILDKNNIKKYETAILEKYKRHNWNNTAVDIVRTITKNRSA